jgi:hypothetical protein
MFLRLMNLPLGKGPDSFSTHRAILKTVTEAGANI